MTTFELGAVDATLPVGWVAQPRSDPARSGSTAIARSGEGEPPSLWAGAFAVDDPEPADAALAKPVAELFLRADAEYEPAGPITLIEVDGFDEAYRVDGLVTLREVGDQPLEQPQRYHLMQAVVAGPGAQRTHIQLAQPADRRQPSVEDEVLGGLRPRPRPNA